MAQVEVHAHGEGEYYWFIINGRVHHNCSYPLLPHDDFYNDWVWANIFGGRYTGVDRFDPNQVDLIEAWRAESSEGYAQHSAAGLFRMMDDTYVVFSAWTDTTGWGCQDDARFTFHDSWDDAVRFGLGDEERGWFGISI